MTKPIEEILAPKPEARPRIYAYSIDDKAHEGLLKVGQTTRDVKQRVAEQVKTAAIKNYKIELDEVRRARRWHDLHRSPGARSARQEGLRERRAGVDALLGRRRADRAQPNSAPARQFTGTHSRDVL